MLGIGWPDLLFIGLLLMLVVKPEEWPKVAQTAGRTLRAVRRQAGPILDEIREVSRSWSEDAPSTGTKPAAIPAAWEPMPQPYQKGGEMPAPPSTPNDR
jgi:Sec-independent protein translocase protein TatA